MCGVMGQRGFGFCIGLGIDYLNLNEALNDALVPKGKRFY